MKSIAIFLLLFTSCVAAKQSDNETSISGIKQTDKKNEVSFAFDAKYFVPEHELIEVNCTLLNKSRDTIYFLTSTCDGLQYSLQYDTSKLLIWPTLSCFTSFPMMEKIPPKRKINFESHFRILKKTDSVCLSFKLQKVDKGLDVSKLSLDDVYNDTLFPGSQLILGPTKIIKSTAE